MFRSFVVSACLLISFASYAAEKKIDGKVSAVNTEKKTVTVSRDNGSYQILHVTDASAFSFNDEPVDFTFALGYKVKASYDDKTLAMTTCQLVRYMPSKKERLAENQKKQNERLASFLKSGTDIRASYHRDTKYCSHVSVYIQENMPVASDDSSGRAYYQSRRPATQGSLSAALIINNYIDKGGRANEGIADGKVKSVDSTNGTLIITQDSGKEITLILTTAFSMHADGKRVR